MIEHNQHQIKEFICAFRYPSTDKPWLYYISPFIQYIDELGFHFEREQKPIQIQVELSNQSGLKSGVKESTPQQVFLNKSKEVALIIGDGYISIHSIKEYPGWEKFSQDFVKPIVNRLLELRENKSVTNVEVVYINSFELREDQVVGNYLSFFPELNIFNADSELSHSFQSSFLLPANTLLTIRANMNIDRNRSVKLLQLIPSAQIQVGNSEERDWIELCDSAHNTAKSAFFKVVTDRLIRLIK